MTEDDLDDDPVCEKCGSEMIWKECWNCVDGYSGHDCGDDCCCCADPEPNDICDICGGDGGWWICPSWEKHLKVPA